MILIWFIGKNKETVNISNNNYKAVNQNYLLASLLEVVLINELGPHKAALSYLSVLESRPEAYEILKAIYKEAGLDYDLEVDNPKSRKSVERFLLTHFENKKNQLE